MPCVFKDLAGKDPTGKDVLTGCVVNKLNLILGVKTPF